MLLMTAANKITSFRFLLCVVYFILLELAIPRREADPGAYVQLMTASFVLFQVIAWSDLLDGYVARKYREVTHFGRIADPLVDKILVCGSFVYFLRIAPLPEIFTAGFVVAVLAREFLVSGIRGAAEAAGIPFPASVWGKLKTLVQNVAVGFGLGYAAWLQGSPWVRLSTTGLMWAALVATVASGLTYVFDARKLLKSQRV